MTLRELLAQDAAGASGEDTIAVLRAGSYSFALVVGAILGREDVLVSPLLPSLGGIADFAGSTIPHDGRAAPVLDPGSIAAGVEQRPRAGAHADPPAVHGERPLPVVRTGGHPAPTGRP